MTTKVAINGFGRIGRLVLRALHEQNRDDIEIVAINDLGSVEMNAHLFEFDSVHGRFKNEVKWTENSIDAGRGPIEVSSVFNPAELPWGDVDIVLECTGIFTGDKAKIHLENGSSRVLVSAPSKGADKTIVYGVNHDRLSAADLHVSNASCTTNCLAPVAKVLQDSVGIAKGFMTTIHSYTGDQPTLDTMHKKDFYRARAAAMSMIPTSTGAAAAVGLVLPELNGKLDGVAIRVPTPNVSCVDLTVETTRATTAEEINEAVIDAASTSLRGVLGYTARPLVSVDFNHNPMSSTFALDQTKVIDGNMVRILSWYDNEWGFSNRMLDTAAEMGKHL
ncbi:type I glyceraldehyde-3-phosphate dehydrogenase [Aliiroseovarius sp.]|uniref:type I glyceraldehyde-3-phosphate dehydrogenase n=1 Tax=Aliiroseovarius sp. TaxID=1872442 RepID=UPI00261F5A48|nr:type I glyceraldehyde-3-phosphate dehydrogenase [Aliiroseovarius sp.]